MSDQYNEAAKKLIALRQRIIAELWEHPAYQALIAELKGRRPNVPYWTPAHAKTFGEHTILIPDNSDELKFSSAQQKWHDVMMAIIDPQQKYESTPTKGKAE